MKCVAFGPENADVVMLLHGGGLSWWNFRAAAEVLSDRYRVVLPILDGHAGSDALFTSIEDNAARILDYIDTEYGGSVLAIGGVSLGAQILLAILTKRPDICRYAVVESASVIPSKATERMIGPAFSASFGLIRQKWFAKMQFRYLRIPADLFDEYYRDTCRITKESMIAFLRANAAYEAKPGLANCRADVRIVVGEKEQQKMLRSAELLHRMLPESRLEIKKGLHHGEYSLNHPEQYVQEFSNRTDASHHEEA